MVVSMVMLLLALWSKFYYLISGQVHVVMDNLPAHKVEEVRPAIEAVGARLVYPYSPP